MYKSINALLALNWVWYAVIAFLPPPAVSSALLNYIERAGVRPSEFGLFCAFVGISKAYSIFRGDKMLQLLLFSFDLATIYGFLGIVILNGTAVGTLGNLVISAAFITLAFVKTAVARDEE
jgi:hypothetical protein